MEQGRPFADNRDGVTLGVQHHVSPGEERPILGAILPLSAELDWRSIWNHERREEEDARFLRKGHQNRLGLHRGRTPDEPDMPRLKDVP